MFHSRSSLFLAVAAAVLLLGCGASEGSRAAAPAPTLVVADNELLSADMEARAKLEELGRVREHHARLIDSIPTPTLTPVPESAEEASAALNRVIAWAEGYPVPAPASENWFDPQQGIPFFRLEGGDWTNRRLRAAHSHRHLFYRTDYPEGIPSFASGSLQRALAGRLAFGAAEYMPVLGSPTPEVVDLFYRRLGWEIRDADGPVVNVWTAYDFYDGDVVQRFAVGGVMVMQVKTTTRTGSELYYLEPGHWLGSVVVERLR